jgi:hypothetical protein
MISNQWCLGAFKRYETYFKKIIKYFLFQWMAPAAKIVFLIGFHIMCLGFLHITRFTLIPIFWNYCEARVLSICCTVETRT